MDTTHYDQILLESDEEMLNKKSEDDEEDDEDVVYTAEDNINQSLKMDLKKVRTSIISYNKDNHQKKFNLSKSIKGRLVKNDESQFVKIIKYILINLTFLIYVSLKLIFSS